MGSKKDKEFARMLERKPTARDKWRAFYRLWRIAHGHGHKQDEAAEDCYHVLFPNWRPIRLLKEETSGSLIDTSRMPKFLRWKFLEHHRRKRLYGNYYQTWREQDKRTVAKLREKGIEITPDEVAETRRKVIQMARAEGMKSGISLPKDDEDLLRLLKPSLLKEKQRRMDNDRG